MLKIFTVEKFRGVKILYSKRKKLLTEINFLCFCSLLNNFVRKFIVFEAIYESTYSNNENFQINGTVSCLMFLILITI